LVGVAAVELRERVEVPRPEFDDPRAREFDRVLVAMRSTVPAADDAAR
jgi:hypothetical protein